MRSGLMRHWTQSWQCIAGMDGSTSYHIRVLCSLIPIAGKCLAGGRRGATRVVAEADEPSGVAHGMLVLYAAVTVMLRSASASALAPPRPLPNVGLVNRSKRFVEKPVAETPGNVAAART
jgi:hypothetical protein